MTAGGGAPADEEPGGLTSWDGDAYQRRFDDLAASGTDVHGEADLVVRLGPSSVLDAGCGTGRVAAELHRRGIEVVGIDRDASMIETARRVAPGVAFSIVDVADADLGRTFALVVMAGNVPLFTPTGTQADLVAGCARHLSAGGMLLAGFQLGRGYPLERYDEHCRAAGLVLEQRWSTWDGSAFTTDADYAVSLHRHRP
jgi:SAM-dependent methyltransferase